MRQVACGQTHDVLRPLGHEEAVLPSAARLHHAATLRDVPTVRGGLLARRGVWLTGSLDPEEIIFR